MGEGGYGAVEPGGEVAVGIEEGKVVGGDAEAGYRYKAHECPVADEQRGRDDDQSSRALGDEADEAGDKVAESDAGEDSVDAQVGVVEVGKAVRSILMREDEDGRRRMWRARAFFESPRRGAGLKREDDGGADEEEEVGEDEVGEGEAVPWRRGRAGCRCGPSRRGR